MLIQYRPVITSHTRGIFCVVPRNTTALATELNCVAHGGFAAWHTRVVCHACASLRGMPRVCFTTWYATRVLHYVVCHACASLAASVALYSTCTLQV